MDADFAWLHDLWQRTLHRRWAVTRLALAHRLSDAGLLLIAEREGRRCGFCGVDSQCEGTAGLILLLIEPIRQRQGIGTELMKKVVGVLGERVQRLNLGAGNRSYFWPGLPYEHDDAWLFFMKQGFKELEFSQDLIQTLTGFYTPAWVAARRLATGTKLQLASPARAAQINAFEQRHFPAWAHYFENEMKQGGYGNILFAEGSDHSVHGSILMKEDAAIPWQETGGTRIGALNTLGVAPERQGQGTGLALAAGAMERLRERGCSSCYIQWTGLADWYGKLGARPWAHYRMAQKPL